MKKILLVMLFVCSFAFADYQFVVENSTMVNTYFNIFNAIAAIFQSDDYVDLLRLVFLLGGFFVFAGSVLKSFDGNASSNLIAPYGKYLAVGLALLTMAFSYKETMWVTTDNLPSFCSTASPTTGFAVEIPSVLGYVFTTTNTVGRGLTSMAETAFSIPNANGTASMTDSGGYLGSLKQTINVLSLNPNDVTLQGMTPVSESSDMMTLWSTFFSKCVYEVANNKGSDGEKILNTMTSSKNIYDWVQNTYLPYSYDGSTKVAGDYLIELNGRTVTCQSYFGILEASTNEFKANFNCALPLAHGGVLELLTGTNVGGSNDLTQIAVQSGLLNALSASKSVTSIGISGANFANGKSRAEANQNNLASAQYMAEMLPFIQMTMRAILYAFFPFVFVVVMLPGGIKVLTQYAQTMIWIELWGPTAAVVNMFVNMQVIEKVGGKYNEAGLTYISSINMLSEANTIAGVGAMLYLTIPALTWLILKGSGQMLGNVAGGLTAKFAQNMMSETQAKDVAQLKASAKSGMSITNTINQLEQSEATNRTGQAIGFQNSGGMDKNLGTKGKIEEAKLRHDFSNVLSQGSDYVKNQSTLGEQKGATESGNVQGYNNGGGFGAANAQAQIQTETGLKTTVKNVNDAGGVSNVANVKSELENKNFNKDMSLNDGTTKQDFSNLGKIDAAVTSGKSEVVEQKGTGAHKDAAIQEELTKVTSAENKKEYAGGSNENVANTEASINVKGFAEKVKIDENTNIHDHENKGLTQATNIVSDSKTMDKFGKKQLTENLTNEKNEKAIKTSTRMDSIENKDDLFKQQAKQDVETKEKVEATKFDSNGDGRTSDSEINKGAKLEDNKAKMNVLAEQTKQDAMIEEGKKLQGANTIKAKEAVAKGDATQNLNKDLATATTFGASAQVVSDTFNKRKDVKNIENLENNGKTAENLGNSDASANLKKLEELDKGTNVLANDVSKVVETQSQQMVSNLKDKGASDLEANKTVMLDMAKRNLYSGKTIQASLGADLDKVEKQKQKALAKTGINAENYNSSNKAISHFEKMANDKELTQEHREIFAQQANNLKEKISSYDKVNNKFETQKVSKINEYQNAGLIQVSQNGEVKYRDTVSDSKNMNQEQKNLYMAQVQGASNAQKTAFVDMEGMDIQKIKDIHGNDMTNVAKATQEWSKNGRFTNDIQFHAVKDGYVSGNTMANINKTVEVAKNMVSIHGAYKKVTR